MTFATLAHLYNGLQRGEFNGKLSPHPMMGGGGKCRGGMDACGWQKS